MKIYVHDQGIILAGKAWEVKAKLKQAKKSFDLVEDWVESVHRQTEVKSPTRIASATAQKNNGSSPYLRPIV
ncbi:Z-ring formation inhibitor MciZ [Alkalihalobacillus deserti]|uniref:Z-ring formation inhibitor MciZ n=1 Tax=Alkalihalobacillus deserti TaxID=2879466 RepID=UPI001D14E30A|nr:Z-ring formation inhibitor MciZ [Alkalihalobacillus deserti]